LKAFNAYSDVFVSDEMNEILGACVSLCFLNVKTSFDESDGEKESISLARSTTSLKSFAL